MPAFDANDERVHVSFVSLFATPPPNDVEMMMMVRARAMILCAVMALSVGNVVSGADVTLQWRYNGDTDHTKAQISE